jgi:prepilin-type N-terminal cleavage/methylation domain-containing protein
MNGEKTRNQGIGAGVIRNMNRKGFTLIELLIVITIIGMMFSVSLPVSWSMYQRYQASLKAEKILTLVSSLRMEAFLYGKERLIQSQDGKLFVDGADVDDFKDIFIQIDQPITFYKAGTTSGGEIKVYAGDNTFVIEIQAPLGGITMKTA